MLVRCSIVIAWAAGCRYDPIVSPDAGPGPHETASIVLALPPETQLDVLIVEDNSRSITGQFEFARDVSVVFHALAEAGPLPDLHIGVVTSDVGVLDVNVGDSSCQGLGDDGHLQNPGCTQLAGNVVTDVDDGGGGRSTNYTGTLDDLLDCLVNLGDLGCGFEQHLEGMRLALTDTTTNAGFLRPTAQLAVVIHADEDDCSAYNPAFFGPATPELGAIDSFRCFQFGDTCNEADPTAIGAHTGCHSNEASPYLKDVRSYIDFLEQLRPGRVTVAAIIGDTTPVEVARRTPMGSTMELPDLVPSCRVTEDFGIWTADPGIRLDEFIRGFGDRGGDATVCSNSYADAMRSFATRIHDHLAGQPCLRKQPWDSDPTLDGVQPSCVVVMTSLDQPPTPVPSCATSSPPCWRLIPDEQCAGLRLDAVGLDPAPGRQLQARCEVIP